jgi:hypothetical protein
MEMSGAMDDLDRLFQYLVNHLAQDAPQYLNRPFQVSELYQRLIPYRYHRDALGFGSADDYEAAMLRLLSGERGYTVVEPEDAQVAMAKEAQMPHPSHGTFREFAAATVTLQGDAIARFTRSDVAYAPPAAPKPAAPSFTPPVFTEPPPPVEPPPPPVTPAPVEPQAPPVPQPDPASPPVPEPEPPPSPMPSTTPQSGFVFEPVEAEPGCPGCGETLPTGRTATFCPFCGLRIGVVACRQCSEPVEPEWRYCLGCGTRVDD